MRRWRRGSRNCWEAGRPDAGLHRGRGQPDQERQQPGGVAREPALPPRKEKNDPGFARDLATGCDYYVNDAFGTAHRAHASTVGITAFLPKSAAGLLMEKELEYLGRVTNNPPRPCIGILAGPRSPTKSR